MDRKPWPACVPLQFKPDAQIVPEATAACVQWLSWFRQGNTVPSSGAVRRSIVHRVQPQCTKHYDADGLISCHVHMPTPGRTEKKATAVGNKAVYSSKIDTEDYVRSSNTKIGDNIVCQDLAGVYIHVVFGQKKKGRRLRTSTCKWARDQASGPYRVGHGIPVTLRDTGAACGRRQHICSVHRAREAHAGLLPCCGSTVEYFLTRSSTTLNSVLNH